MKSQEMLHNIPLGSPVNNTPAKSSFTQGHCYLLSDKNESRVCVFEGNLVVSLLEKPKINASPVFQFVDPLLWEQGALAKALMNFAP